MKRLKAEYLLLILPLLFFAFCGGYFVGRGRQSSEVQIMTEPPTVAEVRQALSEPPTAQISEETEAALPVRLNINTATAEELTTLPGIGEVIAQRIVDYRTLHGSFKAVEELNAVSGIGDKRMEELLDYITVEDTNEDTGR